MGYSVLHSHDAYSLWAVLRESDLQAVCIKSQRYYPAPLAVLPRAFLAGGMCFNRLTESKELALHCQSGFVAQK